MLQGHLRVTMAYWIRCLHVLSRTTLWIDYINYVFQKDHFLILLFIYFLIHTFLFSLSIMIYSDFFFFFLNFRKWHPSFRMHVSQRMFLCENWMVWFVCKMRFHVLCERKVKFPLLAEGVKETHAGDAWGGMWQTAGLLATAHVQELWEMNSLFKVIYLTVTDGMISSLKRDIMLVVKEGFPCLNSHHSQC